LGLAFTAWGSEKRGNQEEFTDFGLFHRAAQNFLEGGSIYQPIPMMESSISESTSPTTQEFHHPNLNPPFQTVLFSPFGQMSFRTANLIWAGFSLVCGTVAAILIGLKGSGAEDRTLASLVLINLLIFYFPTLISVLLGQLSLVPFLFLVLAWLLWRKGRLGIAGGILGILAGIKVFFGAFLVFFLARREWRASSSFVAAGLLTVLFSVVAAGWDSIFEYFQVLGGVNWYGATWNGSILGFVSRLFGEPGNDPLFRLPLLASILGKGLMLLGISLLIVMARRTDSKKPALALNDLAFSSCIALMLLISPLGWMYYFPFLLIPLTVIWRESQPLPDRRRVRTLLVLGWLLSTTPKLLVQFDHLEGDPGLILGWAGTYFYALSIFVVLLWRMQRRVSEITVPT
jgi:hypothetical protein